MMNINNWLKWLPVISDGDLSESDSGYNADHDDKDF